MEFIDDGLKHVLDWSDGLLGNRVDKENATIAMEHIKVIHGYNTRGIVIDALTGLYLNNKIEGNLAALIDGKVMNKTIKVF